VIVSRWENQGKKKDRCAVVAFFRHPADLVSGQKQCISAKILLPPAPSSSTGLPVFKIVLGGTAALRVLSDVGGGTSF
jgi:hypothetical protein